MKEIKQGRWTDEQWQLIREYFIELEDGGVGKASGFEQEDFIVGADSIKIRCREGDQQFAELMMDIGLFVMIGSE